MNGHDATTLAGAQQAREELRERCIALVRRWQPLAQNGWDHSSARKLGEEVDQIAETSERFNLDDVNVSALELAAYLCSFVDDHLEPNARDLDKLADMVNRLGAVLTDLSDTATAAVHSLPSARSANPPSIMRSDAKEIATSEIDNSDRTRGNCRIRREESNTRQIDVVDPDVVAGNRFGRCAGNCFVAEATPSVQSRRFHAAAAEAVKPTRLPRAVCVLGLGANAVPGLKPVSSNAATTCANSRRAKR